MIKEHRQYRINHGINVKVELQGREKFRIISLKEQMKLIDKKLLQRKLKEYSELAEMVSDGGG